MGEWGMLTPQTVSAYINFNGTDAAWSYRAEDLSMAARQAEGVAYLWNTLAKEEVALLADEVGMGKTYQALGVIAMLWKTKPNAKILIMAPNQDICRHWMREYKAFLLHHYRERDHLVRNGADGGPVNAMTLCRNLRALEAEVARGWGRVFLTTTHSLSGLVEDKASGDLGAKAAAAARALRVALKGQLGSDGFDLIIVDEAHALRKAHGQAQRAHAARAFFGKGEDPLGQKVLLLTATPSHSGLHDIANILGYFQDVNREDSAKTLLSRYALRRLRLMEGQHGAHHSKFSYRHELAMPARFKDDANGELFFAMYQKKLVTELKMGDAGRKPMYGYLEGFESVGSDVLGVARTADAGDAEGHADEARNDDFRQAKDTDLLRTLSQRYHDVFAQFPPHPKYGALVERVVNRRLFEPSGAALHLDKHLVFVRRIPSVRELTQRTNRAYDDVFLPKILEALGLTLQDPLALKWKDSNWSRVGFTQLCAQLQNGSGSDDDDEGGDFASQDGDDAVEDADASLNSKVANLFVVKKDLKAASRDVASTDCSNVRSRFRKPESLFALFMEPASDYRSGTYTSYRKGKGDLKDNYVAPAREQRLRRFDELLRQAALGREGDANGIAYDLPVDTAWGLMYPHLYAKEQEKLGRWETQDVGILENFGNYVKAGFLFASPVMTELYCWYKCFSRETPAARAGNVQRRYAGFVQYAQARMAGSLMLRYFRDALASFDTLCGKITDHGLNDWKQDWRTLTGLQDPAWYASSQSGNRQRLILGFNSPFFPNVLIATSVFQEGVNLHLQCRQVHHYGIAWTPGDNEQRVGRVDRLFGCVNEQLRVGAEGSLKICYPYLEGSFDEDQVASFIQKKLAVEHQMDKCLHGEFDRAIDLETRAVDWKASLRQPHVNSNIDPYPASFDRRFQKWQAFPAVATPDGRSLRDELTSRVALALDGLDLYQPESAGINGDALFLADPALAHASGTRRQPILISKRFSARFSALAGHTAYYLTFETPLATRAKLDALDNQALSAALSALEAAFPLVKLALNPDEPHSWFYLHMKIDLPILVDNAGIDMLAVEEISTAFQQLRDCSDLLEQMVFGEDQDLSRDDLSISATLMARPATAQHSRQRPRQRYALRDGEGRWQTMLPLSLQTSCLMLVLSRAEFLVRFPIVKREKRISEDRRLDEHLMSLNHRHPFLKFSRHPKGVLTSLPFPTVDAQQREIAALEAWFDAVTGG